jgi:Asp-tRNA(Asn)/Glu-tRNA(Gln) amidotransferase A subunit family amidase
MKMITLSILAGLILSVMPQAPARRPFQIEEATIRELRREMQARRLTCRELVQHYLNRIEAYDKKGPAINSLVVINPKAIERAAELDAQFMRSGFAGPLHCVPVIVKDNFETIELPTSAGSLSLTGWMSSKDAFQVRKIREAGAVILAKSNMAEFAFSPYETVSSILPGYTRNPYALDRVTAGSSGGTAAAVAASFGAVGLGSDTGNSIRGPSAHQALVGIRSTMGLTSRAGVVPLNLAADIAGPIARTVEDAVAIFQVIAGKDPDDPATAPSEGKPIPKYADALVKDGLSGARLGVLKQAYETPATDPEIVQIFQRAIGELRKEGATVVDSVTIPNLDQLRQAQTGACNQFKWDLNRYLQSREPKPPVTSLDEIIRSRKFHPTVQQRLESGNVGDIPPEDNPGCRSRDRFREQLREAVVKLMDDYRLDALIYPTWSNPPRLIGDLNTPHGDNNQLFSPSTGFPAITVPMGYSRNNTLPAGLQFFGRAWDEFRLIRLAYAYEQATHYRRPPSTTPVIPRNAKAR